MPTARLALLVALALVAPRAALAFDFPEHREMSLRGFAWSLAHADPPQRQRLRALLAALHASFRPPSRVCASLDDFTPSDAPAPRRACFDAADLAALAGDHSGTPAGLRARWLDGPADGSPSAFAAYVSGTWDAHNVGTSPVVCHDERAPADASRLFAALRDLPTLTTALVSADQAYLCLAAHNAQHFRLTRLDPLAAAAEPLPNAFSAYAFYHLHALAAAARAECSEGRARDELRAEALLLELYSEHFLEDALAGGHVATDRLALNAGSAQATHRFYNTVGVRMTAPDDLRERADAIVDTAWRGDRSDRALYLGDDELLGVLDGRHCGGNDRDRCRTLAAGAALVTVSLDELVAVRPGDFADRLAACADEHPRADCGSPLFVQAAVDAGYLAALRLAPRSAEWTHTFAAPPIGTLTRLRGIGGVTWRPTERAVTPGGELSFWGELFLPPFVPPEGLRQVFLGVGLHVRPEWPTSDGYFARPVGARFEAGLSTAFGRLGLGVGGELAVFRRDVADLRPALALELDVGVRGDTRDDLAWLVDVVPSLSVARWQDAMQWAVGFAVGVSYERPTRRQLPCASARRPGGPAPDVRDCDRTGQSAYLRLRP